MRKLLGLASTAVLIALPVSAADYTYQCPEDSNVCSYVNKTPETPKVQGGGGKTADTSAEILAPKNRYLANMSTKIASQNGKTPACNIESMGGATTVTIQGIDVTVYKSAIVRAHAETGSGAQAEGKTAHMHCAFTAKVVRKPK
ncbi:hypothetical protein ELH97_08710 [Rhizobium leguminosarum]|uniref:hypothetical protein n=1 Tax=Rhizobium leguminosarum TaxID=384 RepID=UPI001031D70F|nr:hypothetical protein [Rhizobium leguminosarum]TAX92000.1 hypothetical protein ELH97_08710 [Rhizobium leguminosarum]